MKKVLTCTQIKELTTRLQEIRDHVILPDIQYKEGILEALELTIVDIVIIKEEIEGEITLQELIKEIKIINKEIKIIVIIKENEALKKLLVALEVDIIEQKIDGTIILNYKHQELKEEIDVVKELLIQNMKPKNPTKIKEKKIKKEKKTKRKSKHENTEVISIIGNPGCGKSVLTALISKIVKEKRVLIIDLDFTDSIIHTLFGVTKNPIEKEENKQEIFPFSKWLVKVNNKIDILSNLNEKIELKPDILKIIIEKLKKQYEIILIDNSNDDSGLLLQESDIILYIIESNLSQLKIAKRRLSYIQEKIENENKIKIVINKYNQEHISKSIIKEILDPYRIIGKISYHRHYTKLINKNMNLLGITRKIKIEIRLLLLKLKGEIKWN